MATKRKIATVVYVDESGEVKSKLDGDFAPAAIRWNFHPTGTMAGTENPEVDESMELDLSRVPESLDMTCRAHALRQKIGDTYAGADWAEARESVASMIERIYEGEWTKEREGAGPRPSRVFDALLNVLLAAGREDTEELREKVREATTGSEARAKALANAKVQAEYDRLTAEAAAAKAKASAEAADEADEGDLDDLLE